MQPDMAGRKEDERVRLSSTTMERGDTWASDRVVRGLEGRRDVCACVGAGPGGHRAPGGAALDGPHAALACLRSEHTAHQALLGSQGRGWALGMERGKEGHIVCQTSIPGAFVLKQSPDCICKPAQEVGTDDHVLDIRIQRKEEKFARPRQPARLVAWKSLWGNHYRRPD